MVMQEYQLAVLGAENSKKSGWLLFPCYRWEIYNLSLHTHMQTHARMHAHTHKHCIHHWILVTLHFISAIIMQFLCENLSEEHDPSRGKLISIITGVK